MKLLKKLTIGLMLAGSLACSTYSSSLQSLEDMFGQELATFDGSRKVNIRIAYSGVQDLITHRELDLFYAIEETKEFPIFFGGTGNMDTACITQIENAYKEISSLINTDLAKMVKSKEITVEDAKKISVYRRKYKWQDNDLRSYSYQSFTEDNEKTI